MSKGPISIGAVLLIAGIADHAYAAPKAALCGSDIGQFGQALDPSVAHDCSTYTTMEHATGWLIGGGIALLAIGIIWLLVMAGIIGTEVSRQRRKKGQVKAPQARPGAVRTSSAPTAPTAPTAQGGPAATSAPAGQFGASAPFATPAPFQTPAPFGTPAPMETPAPFGAFGEPRDPNSRA